MSDLDDFLDWFQLGRDRRWISDTACGMHEGSLLTDDEWEAFDNDGAEPCFPVARLYPPPPSTNGNAPSKAQR